MFIDFQSAYDMLWHDGLMIKLKKLGIDGEIFQFIRNFLIGRTMQVKVGNQLSQTMTIENGTLQGSVISPLLFLIMINDLPDTVKSTELTLFADDSCIFKSGRKLDVIIRNVQRSLNALSDWCDSNGFKTSMDKTVAVLFTHRRESIDSSLKLNGAYVKTDRKVKFLVLIFDSKLTWNDHVEHIVDKCKKRQNIMRAVSGNTWGANKKVLLVIYIGLICSILVYGAIAFDSMNNTNKQKLDSIQAQALRIVCGRHGVRPLLLYR